MTGLSARFNALQPDELLRGKPDGTRIYRLFLAPDGAKIQPELVFTLLQRRNVEIVSYDPTIPCYVVLSTDDLRQTLVDLKWVVEVIREDVRKSPRSPGSAGGSKPNSPGKALAGT